jgi:hypothetical protein
MNQPLLVTVGVIEHVDQIGAAGFRHRAQRFSRMVVSPPALLPGLGLAFISAPSRSVYSHQRSPTSFSPTSR